MMKRVLSALLTVSMAALEAANMLNPQVVEKPVTMRPREITVSVIGADLPALPPDGKPTVEALIAHWQKEIVPELPKKPDLIVLPEICDVFLGLRDNVKKAWLAERGDRFLKYLQELARKQHCYIAYPTYRDLPGGKYANCTIFIDREGDVVGIYDKNYPTIGDIDFGAVPGRDATIVKTDFGTVGFVICFDLNFWEFLDRYAAKKPNVMIFSSYYHGGFMQSVWAYRCRAYFIGAAIGRLESTVVNPVGEKVKNSTCYFNNFTTTINTNCRVIHLDENWGKLRAVTNKYGDKVEIRDPGNVGAVLLTSLDPALPIDDVIKEFKIELWDGYYARSTDARNAALGQDSK